MEPRASADWTRETSIVRSVGLVLDVEVRAEARAEKAGGGDLSVDEGDAGEVGMRVGARVVLNASGSGREMRCSIGAGVGVGVSKVVSILESLACA